MKRPLFAWLMLVLLLEANGILLLKSWLDTKTQLVNITNLMAAVPDGMWWGMAINQTCLVLLIGVLCIKAKWYGVLTGIILFLLALPFLSEIL